MASLDIIMSLRRLEFGQKRPLLSENCQEEDKFPHEILFKAIFQNLNLEIHIHETTLHTTYLKTIICVIKLNFNKIFELSCQNI